MRRILLSLRRAHGRCADGVARGPGLCSDRDHPDHHQVQPEPRTPSTHGPRAACTACASPSTQRTSGTSLTTRSRSRGTSRSATQTAAPSLRTRATCPPTTAPVDSNTKNQFTGAPVQTGRYTATLTVTNQTPTRPTRHHGSACHDLGHREQAGYQVSATAPTPAHAHTRSCYLEQLPFGSLYIDCWGGREAVARYGFTLPRTPSTCRGA